MPAGFRSPAKIARRLRMAPLASRAVENWSSFVYHYALGLTPEEPYRFRGGARLRISRGTDHVPLIEVFLRKDYGEIPDGAVIVDLGASIGAFTIYAATSARNVRVFAYEPMPEFFEVLQKNVTLNGLEGCVTCFNLAVAADRSERDLFVSGPDFFFPTLVRPHAADVGSTRVACTDLPAILESNALARVDLLKMDIEGTEYDVLYGTADGSLSRVRELRMEYHNLDADRRNVNHLKQFLTARRWVVTRDQPNTPVNGTLWATQHD
jgi:FkbM family methyltransferase